MVVFTRSQRRKNTEREKRDEGVLEDVNNEEGENKKRGVIYRRGFKGVWGLGERQVPTVGHAKGDSINCYFELACFEENYSLKFGVQTLCNY